MGQINSKTGTQMPSTSGVDDDVISETGIEYAYYSLYYDSALVDSSEKDFDGLSVSVIGYGNNLKLRIVNNGEEERTLGGEYTIYEIIDGQCTIPDRANLVYNGEDVQTMPRIHVQNQATGDFTEYYENETFVIEPGEEICVDLFCANLLLSIKESRDDCGKTTDCKVVFGDIEMEFSICVEEAC